MWAAALRRALTACVFIIVAGSIAQAHAATTSSQTPAPYSNGPVIISAIAAIGSIIVALVTVVGPRLMDRLNKDNSDALMSALAEEHRKAQRLEEENRELRQRDGKRHRDVEP